MAVEERDAHTGYLTTGHEWNGITELNTPVPRAVYAFIIVTHVWALFYWVLMPAFPLWTTYTKGLLGYDDRQVVKEELQDAAKDRAAWTTEISGKTYPEIQADPRLMKVVRETGRSLFGDNCAACHGRDHTGSKGIPSLVSRAWLWGGTPDDMEETIRVGINAAHTDTRASQMLAFGRDGIIQRSDVENVVAYVESLSKRAPEGIPAERLSAGKAVFEANCAACHGEDGRGKIEVGAPDLTDEVWIHGSDRQSIYNIVWSGRQGHMPTWETRLSAVDRKILVLYLLDARGKHP